ncbi:hypothetical protein ARSEF4850_006983 [Beauveria asiatica]
MPVFVHFLTLSIMNILFQQPFTESAYTEAKKKESKAAQKRSTKQPPSKRNDTPTSALSKHAVSKEPVINLGDFFCRLAKLNGGRTFLLMADQGDIGNLTSPLASNALQVTTAF